MARNGQAQQAAQPAVSEGPIGNVDQLSRELAQRFPDRFVQRFVMPFNVREAREVFLMEITNRDEINAAVLADALMSAQERASYKLAADAERRECIRISLVAIGEGKVGAVIDPKTGERAKVPVAYRHTGADGLPFVEINDWSGKAWAALHTFFGQLNGVPTDELRQGIEGAQTVGAFAPPQSETLASADPGR